MLPRESSPRGTNARYCNLRYPRHFRGNITETAGEIFSPRERSEILSDVKWIGASRCAITASHIRTGRGQPNYRAPLTELTCSLLSGWPVTDTLDSPRALAQPMLRIPGGRSRAGPRTRTHPLSPLPSTRTPASEPAHDDPFLPSRVFLSLLPSTDSFLSEHDDGEESRIFIPC